MDFLKRNCSTLLLIGIAALWIGLSLGTQRCPSCVIRDIVMDAVGKGENEEALTARAESAKPAMPEWEAIDINGQPIGSADLAGKVSVVMYWATYCSGCKNEIPDLVALRNEFPPERVEILALSVDDARKDLQAYARERGINYRIARVNDSVVQAFGRIDSIPTLIIMDAQGRPQFRYSGHLAKETLSERVRDLLPSHASALATAR